jgi:hypothetical protein
MMKIYVSLLMFVILFTVFNLVHLYYEPEFGIFLIKVTNLMSIMLFITILIQLLW